MRPKPTEKLLTVTLSISTNTQTDITLSWVCKNGSHVILDFEDRNSIKFKWPVSIYTPLTTYVTA